MSGARHICVKVKTAYGSTTYSALGSQTGAATDDGPIPSDKLTRRTVRKRVLAEEIASASSMRTAKIAIIDDDGAVREAMKLFMRSLGYHTSTFGSADKFLNSEQISDTSCLITDVQMPGLNGCDLQDRLIARGHRIPIIFITGHPDENVRARAIKAGAVAFLTKPVNPDHLLGYLGKALKAA